MTGYTVHTGSTVKFSEGWDQIFRTKGHAKSPAKGSKPAKKKSASKAAAKKARGRKPKRR
jgi:hypothetical protein